MASILKKIAGKIGRLLARKTKPPVVKDRLFKVTNPDLPAGHRGIAMGDVQARHRAFESGQPAFTVEETEKWKQLTQGEVSGFLYDQQIIFVHSSNVAAMQFFIDSNKLLVEFKGKRGRSNSSYLYSNVTEKEALGFINAASKGSEVWSVLRVRGSKTAHRKPFVQIR